MARRKLEGEFYKDVLEPEIERRLPGCKILKMDPLSTHQGIPDRLILWEDHWALLETKRADGSAEQPNQDYYVERYGNMSFSRFVNPDNMQEVLDDLQQAFGVAR